jgi:hypothetical protein
MVQSRRIDSNLVFADRFEHQRILSAAGSIRSTDTQRAWRFVPAQAGSAAPFLAHRISPPSLKL